MKKLLLAFFALPMLTFGQGSQNFEGVTAITSVYSAGTFTDGGITWAFSGIRDQDTFPISGNGIIIRRGSDSYLEWTIPNGIGNLSFEYRKAYTGQSSREIEVLINNVQVAVTPSFGAFSGADATVYTLNEPINESGSVVVKIKPTGTTTTGRQATIDNISWTAYTLPSTDCGITNADLSALVCNNNATPSDPNDDYLTFDLNPTGENLGANGYTVSVSSGTITPTTGIYGAATSFQLQGGSAGDGDVVVTITDADSTSCSLDVTVTDPGVCSSATPVITVTPATLTGFNHVVGTPSTSQTFTTSGIALTEDITLTASTGFEISLTSGGTYASSLVLPHVTGTVAPTTVYVRGNSATYGAFAGHVIATSTGADNDSVAVSGFANDYVYYTIDQIDGVNANGVADSLGVLVKVSGVVHCMDFRAGAGYNMTIIDGSGKGIYIFSNADVSGYTNPVAGDSISVRGTVAQFNGLLQIATLNSIVLETSGAATNAPIVVTALTETTENQYITLENVTLVTPIATFPTTATNLDVTNGTSTFQIRILPATDLAGAPAPQGPFNVTGIGSQFDSSIPHDSGYQLLPCGTDAIEIVCAGANLPSVATTLTDKTITATATGSVTYKWINCADNAVISGATAASYSPSTPGEYAVIVDNGTCSDTSACVTVDNLSITDVEFGQSIVTFPNPVNNELTIKNYSGTEVTFVVVDINGKVITENKTLGTNTVINTASWNKGVYFVNFYGSNKATHTVKIVK